jgi:hypothetical protein
MTLLPCLQIVATKNAKSHRKTAKTAGYEILRADPPTKGTRVGFELYAHTADQPQQGFGVYRMARLDHGEVYYVSGSYLIEDGTPGWRNKHVPSTVKAGRMRVARTGTQGTAWAAEGSDGAPIEGRRTVRKEV